MSIIDVMDISLDEKQAQILKNMVQEAVDTKYQMDAHKDFLKDIRNRAKDELKIPPKLFNKLIVVAYKKNANRLNKEVTALLDLAEQIGEYNHNEE